MFKGDGVKVLVHVGDASGSLLLQETTHALFYTNLRQNTKKKYVNIRILYLLHCLGAEIFRRKCDRFVTCHVIVKWFWM